jgi:predicted MPP superfamily phosphohydrolase
LGTKFQAGDINKASDGVRQEDFKILMSHDPSWDYEIKNHEKNFHLTLSGHTHGMQFGIEIRLFQVEFSSICLHTWAYTWDDMSM